jgi:hypothetical protein
MPAAGSASALKRDFGDGLNSFSAKNMPLFPNLFHGRYLFLPGSPFTIIAPCCLPPCGGLFGNIVARPPQLNQLQDPCRKDLFSADQYRFT